MTGHILLVEDEDHIARLLELELSHEGYHVERSDNGKSGLEKAVSGEWDLILLDIMLPEMSGLEVLRKFRKHDPDTPVIMLTARDEKSDVVTGLDRGADDYMTKPFEMEELLARIRTCIRRKERTTRKPQAMETPDELQVDELTVNRKTREVWREERKIDLTPKEFDLLVYLLVHKGEVLSREDIINDVWQFDFMGDTNIVDVYIRYVRKKIDYSFDRQLIQTIRGVGYSIRGEPE